MRSLYDFTATDMAGRAVSLGDYRGQVLLIVNTASKCGFTPQYSGLEALYRDLQPRGLTILGFPCNQFASQEPGGPEDIARFCRANYGVSFPMFAKIDVNGPAASPLYAWLKQQAPGLLGSQGIKWNFTKFLIDREGRVVQRFAPSTKPAAIRCAIERLL